MKRVFPKLLILLLCFSACACAPKIPKDALRLSSESLKQRELQTRYFETGSEINLLSASAQVLQDMGFNLDESETSLGVVCGSKHRDATDSGQIAASVTMAILFGVYVPTDQDQVIRVSLITKPADYNRNEETALTDKMRQEVVLSMQDKTREALTAELGEKLSGKLDESVIMGITNQMVTQFGEELSHELKARLDEGRTAVRVTFQRIIYNSQRQITTREAIDDPSIYKEFFEKLGESVFLEAHAI